MLGFMRSTSWNSLPKFGVLKTSTKFDNIREWDFVDCLYVYFLYYYYYGKNTHTLLNYDSIVNVSHKLLIDLIFLLNYKKNVNVSHKANKKIKIPLKSLNKTNAYL